MSNKKTQRNHYTSVAKRRPVLRNASVIILGFLIFIAVIVCYTVATQASDVGLPSPTHANVESMAAQLNQPTFPEATVFDSALVSEIQTKLRALGYNDVEINGLSSRLRFCGALLGLFLTLLKVLKRIYGFLSETTKERKTWPMLLERLCVPLD